MEWLDQNRTLVRAVTQRDGLRLVQQFAAERGVLANQLLNPRFRVLRRDMLAGAAIGHEAAISPWQPAQGTVYSTTTITTDPSTGTFSVNDSTTGTDYRIDLKQRLNLRPSEDYFWSNGLDFRDATNVDTTATFIELLPSTTMWGTSQVLLQNVYPAAGAGKMMAARFLPAPPRYLYARFDCTTGSCAAATITVGPQTTQITSTWNSTGNYTAIWDAVSLNVPLTMIQSETANVHCTASGQARLATVLCKNDAGVATDADYK